MANTLEGGRKGAATRAKNKREMPLTEPEREFVLHYLGAAKRNATEAVLLSPFNITNRNSARAKAYAIMARPRVIAEIEAQTEARNERLKFTADDLLRELFVLKVDAEVASRKSNPAMRIRLDVLKTIGEHVNVNAFRKQVGLSNPEGGPIGVVDAAWLAQATDEELQKVEDAWAIINKLSGNPGPPAIGGDQGGTGAASESE